MRNVLFLVIDSMNYTRMLQNRELTPFLNELEEKYVSCDRMYSQAPYTEAAVMSLYCGQNVLDRGGYMERYNNCPKTLFEIYRENGFDTYYNSFQPQVFPSSLRRGVSANFCNVGYDFGALWHYRLQHYCSIPHLADEDMSQLIRLMDDNLSQWRLFLLALQNAEHEVEMIYKNNKNYDVASALRILEGEIDKYRLDKDAYITELLRAKLRHALFTIPYFSQPDKLTDEEKAKVRSIMTPVFKTIRQKVFIRNLRNSRLPFGKLLKAGLAYLVKPNMEKKKNAGKTGLAMVNTLFDPDLYSRIKNPGTHKNAPSLRTHSEHFFQWLDCRMTENPFFACIHVDDIHGPEAFFTYDTGDDELLCRDRDAIVSYLKRLPTDFCGSITHDLSLQYIDNAIRDVFQQMEKRQMLENTTVYIMADHGFAFQYSPVRTTMGIDFYLENYHIPFIIVDKDLSHFRVKGKRESKDIPATALTLSNIPVPEHFSGRSVLCGQAYDTLFIEYCGSGCPDLRRRKLMLGAFNDDCLIGVMQCLYPQKERLVIGECYDLKKDPQQIRKIAPDSAAAKKLLAALEARRSEIIRQLDATTYH